MVFTMGYIGYEQVNYVPENVLVNLCSDNKDKYEFGFNGQMKVNEIAGIGNWNTAEFWEYNTRTGRRANLDPKPQICMSDYTVMAGNPIRNTDVQGDVVKGDKGSVSDVLIFQNKLLKTLPIAEERKKKEHN